MPGRAMGEAGQPSTCVLLAHPAQYTVTRRGPSTLGWRLQSETSPPSPWEPQRCPPRVQSCAYSLEGRRFVRMITRGKRRDVAEGGWPGDQGGTGAVLCTRILRDILSGDGEVQLHWAAGTACECDPHHPWAAGRLNRIECRGSRITRADQGCPQSRAVPCFRRRSFHAANPRTTWSLPALRRDRHCGHHCHRALAAPVAPFPGPSPVSKRPTASRSCASASPRSDRHPASPGWP